MSRIIPFIAVLLISGCPLAAQSVPFQLHGGYLIVAKCSVADTPDLTAVIDTGVTETVIDMGLARRLRLPAHPDSAIFVAGEGAVKAVSIPSVHLGPLQAESLAGIAVDLAKLNRDFGIHPDLVIGMDLLRRSNFTIDYKSHELIFGFIPTMAHVAPLTQNSRLALIESTVSGRTMRLQVDTGFNGLLLYGDRFRVAETPGKIGAHLVGIAQTTSVQSANVDFQVGDWHARNIAASIVESDTLSHDFDGLLGGQILTRHRLAFDFERMIVTWE